jgi:thioredoxin-dependent peroxiredoxin
MKAMNRGYFPLKFLKTKLMDGVLPLCFLLAAGGMNAAPPGVGDKAPDFSLMSTKGTKFRLSERSTDNVVLVVLRGYPGYQCPNCNRQVQDFIQNATSFAEAGASVIFVYPGPPDQLAAKAAEFLKEKRLPDHFEMLLDPDYQFTRAYGLRWEAAKETAYPSTFLIDRQGVVFFTKVVKSHGGRTTAAEILQALPRKAGN